MTEKTKTVFYCDFCRKHGLSRRAMEKHELYCTMNPNRRCRWYLNDYYPSARMLSSGSDTTHRMRRGLPRWVRIFALADEYTPPEEREKFMARLREHALGCPACMLAAIRQSGVDTWRIRGDGGWDYEREVQRFRKEEREHWEYEERRAIEATFL